MVSSRGRFYGRNAMTDKSKSSADSIAKAQLAELSPRRPATFFEHFFCELSKGT
jgi:hypothetical protein